MVAPFTPRIITVILLMLVVTCICFHTFAQVATQNLFKRAQYIEYLRLRNQSGIQIYQNDVNQIRIKDNRIPGQIVEFNVRCKPTPVLHKVWLVGEVHFAFNRWHEAIGIFSDLIRTDSSFCDAYFRLAQCYIALNDLSAGYNILMLAGRKFPDDPLLNVGLGQLYIMLWFPKSALFYFEKQILLHPIDPEGFLGASAAAAELDDFEKAIRYLKQGRELLVDQIVAATGRLARSSSVSPSIKNPLGATVDYLYLFESLLYNKLNQNEKSRDVLRHLTDEQEREIAPYASYFEGIYFYNKGEKFYNKARRNIKKAAFGDIEVEPGILRQLGLRSDPTDFKAMALRENYSKLPTRMRSAISPMLIKADTLFQNSFVGPAAEVYEQCIQEDSTNLIAYERLGECYRHLQRQDEAVQIFRLANRKFPQEVKFTLLLARELMRIGQTDEAIANYRRAIALDKRNDQTYYGACLALAHQGDFRDAFELWTSAGDYLSDLRRETHFMSGLLQYKLGNYSAAISSLSNRYLLHHAASKYYLSLSYHFLKDRPQFAASNMIDAINLGAIVSAETVRMVGLDPAVHRSF